MCLDQHGTEPTFAYEKTSMAVRWRPTLVLYHRYQIDPQFGWTHPRGGYHGITWASLGRLLCAGTSGNPLAKARA